MFDVAERQRGDVISHRVCGLTDLVEQSTSSSEEPSMASFLNSLKAGHIEGAGRASRARKTVTLARDKLKEAKFAGVG
jgi:hypothetical protein